MKAHSEKKFNAVEFQRKRRRELSELFFSNPVEFSKRLENVRKKYKNKFHLKAIHTA